MDVGILVLNLKSKAVMFKDVQYFFLFGGGGEECLRYPQIRTRGEGGALPLDVPFAAHLPHLC